MLLISGNLSVPGSSAWMFMRMSLLFCLCTWIPLQRDYICICPLYSSLYSLSANIQGFRCLRGCSFSYCWAPGPNNASQVLSMCGGSLKATLGNVPFSKHFWNRCPQYEPKPRAVITSAPVLTNGESAGCTGQGQVTGHFTHNSWCTTSCPLLLMRRFQKKKPTCFQHVRYITFTIFP